VDPLERPNRNYAKLGHTGVGARPRDLLLTPGTPYISQERLKLETPERAVCASYYCQFTPPVFTASVQVVCEPSFTLVALNCLDVVLHKRTIISTPEDRVIESLS